MFQIHQPYYISINKSQGHKIPIANIPLTSTKSQFPPPLWFPYSATWPSAVPAALPADLRGAAGAAGAAMSRPGPRPASLPIFWGSGRVGKHGANLGKTMDFPLVFD